MAKAKNAPPPSTLIPDAAPKFRDPGPAMELGAVPDMPPEAAALFAARGVRTLADLRPLVESEAAGDEQCEPVYVLTSKWELPILVRYKAGAALIALLGGRAHMLQLMASWPKAVAPAPAHDFDENTPPPKGRPRGVPLPREYRLPPGEDSAGVFGQWDREGRIAAGSILCEFIGLAPCGSGASSGLKLLAMCAGITAVATRTGSELSPSDAARFTAATVVRRERSPVLCVVLAPVRGVI